MPPRAEKHITTTPGHEPAGHCAFAYADTRRTPRWAADRAKARWHAGPQPGVVAMCSSARAGEDEGAVACSSIDLGRPGALLTTGQPNGIWLGLWGSASGGAAPSAPLLIWTLRRIFTLTQAPRSAWCLRIQVRDV